MSETAKVWKPGREPWCWQPKAALRRIREALDAENAVASGLLVYVALTEIASDKQSQTFPTTHGYIAGRTGLSPRTVQQRIKDLTSIGVLKCVVPALRAPATYTLLEIETNPDTQPLPRVVQPLLNDTKQLPNDTQPLQSVTQRSKNASLPTLEESPEESKNNQGKKLPPALGTAERISLEKTHREIRDEIKQLGKPDDYDPNSKKRQRLLQLMQRDVELQEILWGLTPIANGTAVQQPRRMTEKERIAATL